jgi:hypothetical protein
METGMRGEASVSRIATKSIGAIGGALLAVLGASFAIAQPTSEAKAFESDEFHYKVSLPAGCRYEEGPGTLDAVCSPELDAEKSNATTTAAALLLEVGVETVADDAGKTPADLVQRYGEAEFKAELPESVCGESERTRVKIENSKQVLDEARVMYTADVTCPEIKFLGLGERRAAVQVLITPGLRYRLMARALKDDFEQRKEVVDAFFTSFRFLPESKKSQ